MTPQSATDTATLFQRPAEILQQLIRFNTANPPGNEGPCIQWIDSLLTAAGIKTHLLARDGARPNLICRLAGRGRAVPLLWYGHIDVVGAGNEQRWLYPPFAGTVADGCVWGRGAIDMKAGIAMMLAALLRAKAEKRQPAGDIILAVLSDEELGGTNGARFLVEEHPDLFDGVRYAVSEFGGFTFYAFGRKFYPIMVAEKQACWMRATLHGPGGHGSMPVRGGAMAKLGAVLCTLNHRRLPVHITPAARLMVQAVSRALPLHQAVLLRMILNPKLTDLLLGLAGDRASFFDPLLHNTVCATVVKGGEIPNVIPNEVGLALDGRLLPGYTPEDLIAELRLMLKDINIELEIIYHHPGPAQPDMGLYDTLAGVLRAADPAGVPIPLLLSGTTDARFFASLGIQTYGYLPMNLPPGFSFTEVLHAPNERIPVTAVEFGVSALYALLEKYS